MFVHPDIGVAFAVVNACRRVLGDCAPPARQARLVDAARAELAAGAGETGVGGQRRCAARAVAGEALAVVDGGALRSAVFAGWTGLARGPPDGSI